MKYFFFFTRLLIQMRLKFWHRLPQQMPIRCYLIEGQSRTNKSSSLYQRMERILFPVLPHFEIKQRRLEKRKTTSEHINRHLIGTIYSNFKFTK